jgi:alpha-N-arabinofuranosidase
MNRRRFLLGSIAAGAVAAAAPDERVTVLLVDTDRVSTPIDERIYGQFLEHINHSVDGH